jgi:hypothetical protein
MGKLLLFFVLAYSISAFGQAAINPDISNQPVAVAPEVTNPYAGMPRGLNALNDNQTNASEQVRTCLRIHAFIFKAEDDQVPQLVRETTCMPASSASAKKADLTVQPKPMPATGGNHF